MAETQLSAPADILRRVTLLRGCSDDTLRALTAALEPRTLVPGEVVCREGEPGDHFYVVGDGTLTVSIEIGGRDRAVAHLEAGAFFGEMALLGGGTRTATVTADGDAHVWSLRRDDFTRLVESDPDIGAALADAAAAHAMRSETLAYEVTHRNLAEMLGDRTVLSIGRDPENDLVLPSRLVSRFHAALHRNGAAFELVDLVSDGGTYVNGIRVRSAAMADGDEIWLGDQRFFFESTELAQVAEPLGIRIDAVGLTKELKRGKTVLHDVSLSVLPGELVAIVGSSGAGKSTLLDALAGLRPATSGTVYFNGRELLANLPLYRDVLGYVPQDDIIQTELPLRSTLRHAAKLRLPMDSTGDDIDAAVSQAIDHLGLNEQSELPVHQLSGGQRKRCSIGVELLTEARVMFLDEPTSGLDPAMDGQMMRLLRRLADEGSTVLVTTHATKNVSLCDKVVFLAGGGHVAYVGPPGDALAYFGTEDFDEIYDRLTGESTPEEWDLRFRSSSQHPTVAPPEPDATSSGGTAPRSPLQRLRRGLHQFRVLSARNADARIHDKGVMGPLVGQTVILTLVLLALYSSGVFGAGANPSTPMTLILLLVFMAFINGLLISVLEVAKELPIFLRERMVGVGAVPFVLSKVAFLAPVIAVSVTFILVVMRLTNRLPSEDLSFYGQLWFTLVLSGLAGMSTGLMTSAIASSPKQATDILPVWLMPQVLFSGALFAVPDMNIVGRLISNLMVTRWGFEGSGDAVDILGVFQRAGSPSGDGLFSQYRTSFQDALPGHWVILAAFVIIPLAAACAALKAKRAI